MISSIKKGDEVVSEEVEKGRIVSQDPRRRYDDQDGKYRDRKYQQGPGRRIDVPDLRGKKQERAWLDYLEAAGFKLGTVSEEASEEEAGHCAQTGS